MAGGWFLNTITPKYGNAFKVIAPFGTTLDYDMWRGALWYPPGGTMYYLWKIFDRTFCNIVIEYNGEKFLLSDVHYMAFISFYKSSPRKSSRIASLLSTKRPIYPHRECSGRCSAVMILVKSWVLFADDLKTLAKKLKQECGTSKILSSFRVSSASGLPWF